MDKDQKYLLMIKQTRIESNDMIITDQTYPIKAVDLTKLIENKASDLVETTDKEEFKSIGIYKSGNYMLGISKDNLFKYDISKLSSKEITRSKKVEYKPSHNPYI